MRLYLTALFYFIGNSFLVFSQDTIRYYSNLNVFTNAELKAAIDLYESYIDEKSDGGNMDYRRFWEESEVNRYKIPDLASHYMLPKDHMAIMGLAKLDSNRFLLKTVGFMDRMTNEVPEIMYIYNYIVHKRNGSYRLGNYLDYIIEKDDYRPLDGSYGRYYGYNLSQKEAIDSLFSRVEEFFGTKFDQRFTIVNFPSSLTSLNSRGYDYFIGALNSKTTVSGLFNPDNNIIYTTGIESIHVHEVLRSLHALLPKSPIILRNGIANLCGGSLGMSIEENIRLIHPYLQKNAHILKDLSNFYYYDDQVVPHAVFTAIVTNYYLKHFGTASFKKLMGTEEHTKISIEDFLLKFCGVSDPSVFLMREMARYLEKNLEYSDLFKN
jgi:hypothetical protein